MSELKNDWLFCVFIVGRLMLKEVKPAFFNSDTFESDVQDTWTSKPECNNLFANG
jgi:hypothetical protein